MIADVLFNCFTKSTITYYTLYYLLFYSNAILTFFDNDKLFTIRFYIQS